MAKQNMQRQIDQLVAACSKAGISVDQLLQKPLTEIVPFAQQTGIRLDHLRDICVLLIQRLDELDAECATFQRLTFLDPILSHGTATRVHAAVN